MTKAQREYQRAWRKKNPDYDWRYYKKTGFARGGGKGCVVILGVRCRWRLLP